MTTPLRYYAWCNIDYAEYIFTALVLVNKLAIPYRVRFGTITELTLKQKYKFTVMRMYTMIDRFMAKYITCY